ncbi:ABC transporter permease [Pseudomonas sp. CGJS7]|uniref:ABC transporter permease n=1 Tax=Pseudomonas sp. CGJS7 TaxID=3109348 RepID=UPI00300B892F
MSAVKRMRRGWANVSDAARSLARSPRASLLCASAIVLAVMAYSTIASIAEGMAQVLGRRFETLGQDTLVIRGQSSVAGGFVPGPGDLSDLQQRPNWIARAALVQELSGAATLLEGAGTRQVAQVLAVSEDYFSIDRVVIGQGRHFGARAGATRQCVLGARIAARLFPRQSPLGRFVRVGGQWFAVSGVLKATDEPGKFVSNDDALFLPLAGAGALIKPGDDGGRLVLKAAPGVDIERLREQVRGVLLRKYNGRFDADDFRIEARQSLLDSARAATQSQGRTVAWISLLASLVAALGVMNMMFLAADERSGEIGLRRAVGATQADIAWLFVLEALWLCLLSIPLGLLLGRGAATVLQQVLRLDSAPTLSAQACALVAVATTALVVAFSLAPAWQAARKDPKQVLRSQ